MWWSRKLEVNKYTKYKSSDLYWTAHAHQTSSTFGYRSTLFSEKTLPKSALSKTRHSWVLAADSKSSLRESGVASHISRWRSPLNLKLNLLFSFPTKSMMNTTLHLPVNSINSIHLKVLSKYFIIAAKSKSEIFFTFFKLNFWKYFFIIWEIFSKKLIVLRCKMSILPKPNLILIKDFNDQITAASKQM